MRERRKARVVSKAFHVMEATSYQGGFGVFMNNLIDNAEAELDAAGAVRPYFVRFVGNRDGYSVPLIINVFEAD